MTKKQRREHKAGNQRRKAAMLEDKSGERIKRGKDGQPHYDGAVNFFSQRKYGFAQTPGKAVN